MLPPDAPHPTIRHSLRCAALPAEVAFLPGPERDGIFATGGFYTARELPRLEVLEAPSVVVELALSLADHVADGLVQCVLVDHQSRRSPWGRLALHRLEIRLGEVEHRDIVWARLAESGVATMRWLLPPCRTDAGTYAVVQGPVRASDWPEIVAIADREMCSHLVVLCEQPPYPSPYGFSRTTEIVSAGPHTRGLSKPPTRLETASTAFEARVTVQELVSTEFLFNNTSFDTIVLRGERPGFAEPGAETWSYAASLTMGDGARHAICPGPFRESRKVVVICHREHRISFHSTEPSP